MKPDTKLFIGAVACVIFYFIIIVLMATSA